MPGEATDLFQTIHSIPAIHTGGFSVSFTVEYTSLKIIFGGDASPNTWFIEHTVDADVVIHEVFNPSEVFAKLGSQPGPTMTH